MGNGLGLPVVECGKNQEIDVANVELTVEQAEIDEIIQRLVAKLNIFYDRVNAGLSEEATRQFGKILSDLDAASELLLLTNTEDFSTRTIGENQYTISYQVDLRQRILYRQGTASDPRHVIIYQSEPGQLSENDEDFRLPGIDDLIRFAEDISTLARPDIVK